MKSGHADRRPKTALSGCFRIWEHGGDVWPFDSNRNALKRPMLPCRLATDFGVCEQYGFGRVAEILQRQVQARRTWGDAYGHILVATGRADIMLDPIMNVWDCAALLPILEEAGGTFTDWKGQRTIHGGNAISTNGTLFGSVMAVIEKAEKS